MKSPSSKVILPCAVLLVGVVVLVIIRALLFTISVRQAEMRGSPKPFHQHINAPTQTDTAFFNAMSQGDGGKAEALLKKGADIDTRDPWQKTFLISYAMSGDAQTVTWLLDHGANIDAVDNGKMSALFHAVLSDHPKVVDVLLKRGADWRIPNFGGITAWDKAKEPGRRTPHQKEIVALFNKAGAK